MKIQRFIGGILESNGYVIYQQEGGHCYIIDPGYKANVFLEYMEKMKLDLQGILLTHNHYDHVGAVEKIKNTIDCSVYLHRDDADGYKGHAEVLLEDGDHIQLNEETIDVVGTPGHTAGSVCFYSEKSKVAFTGDTIFNVDLGRTDLATGSEAQMIHSCKGIIDKWSNEIFIYPGHGDGCTMKTVRKINREFLDIIRR